MRRIFIHDLGFCMYPCPFAPCYRAPRIRLVGLCLVCIIILSMVLPMCRVSRIVRFGTPITLWYGSVGSAQSIP